MSKVSGFSIFNLKNIEIGCDGKYKLDNKDHSFGDIFKRVKEISREERKAGNIDNLNTVSAFLGKLKLADNPSKKRWFHRLFHCRSHAQKIDAELKKIDRISPIVKDAFYDKKLKECLANKDPKNAEEALSHLFPHSERRAAILKEILALYLEKGDSTSLVAAFSVIRQISGTLAGGPNERTFDRTAQSMRVVNGLLEKNNNKDLLLAASIISQFGWRNVSREVEIDITTKVVDRLIQMAEKGDLSGLDLAKKIALHTGNWEGYTQRIEALV